MSDETKPVTAVQTWTERARTISTNNAFEPATIADAVQLAQMVAKAQLVPKHFQERPADILVAMMMARQLGIPGILAVQQGNVINGKFGLPAVMIHALCEQDPSCEYMVVAEATETQATIEVKRREWPAPRSLSFTFEMAKRAGYTSKNPNYATQPRNMLIARARSEAARAFFPGRVTGLYSVEELRDLPMEPWATDAPGVMPPAGRLDAITARVTQTTPTPVSYQTVSVPDTMATYEAPPEPPAPASAPIVSEEESEPWIDPQAGTEAPTLFEEPPTPALAVPLRAQLAAEADRRLGRGGSGRLIAAVTKQFGSWVEAPPEAAAWASDWMASAAEPAMRKAR